MISFLKSHGPFLLLICLTLSFTLCYSFSLLLFFSSFFHLICAHSDLLGRACAPRSLTLILRHDFQYSSPSVGVFVVRLSSYIVAQVSSIRKGCLSRLLYAKGLRNPSPIKIITNTYIIQFVSL